MSESGVQKLRAETILVPIVGTSPLIVHKFSEKAKRQMLDRSQNRKSVKDTRDPVEQFMDATYRFEDGGYGFPAVGFKACTVSAARFYGSDVTMTSLRQFLFFQGEMGLDGQQLVRIEPGEGADTSNWPRMREDRVTVGKGGSELRYRPEFWPWAATLRVTYITTSLTFDSVLSLIDAGGLGVGVGDWRPEKSGDFGQFKLDMSRGEVDVLREGISR